LSSFNLFKLKVSLSESPAELGRTIRLAYDPWVGTER